MDPTAKEQAAALAAASSDGVPVDGARAVESSALAAKDDFAALGRLVTETLKMPGAPAMRSQTGTRRASVT